MSMSASNTMTILRAGPLDPARGYLASKEANLRLIWLRSALGDYTIPVMPANIQICSSYRCVYQCRFCGGHGISDERHQKLNRQEAMPTHRLTALLAEALPTCFTWSVASSGEFFCQPDIAGILAECAPYKAKASITTNGALMTPELAGLLIPCAASIRVSMASATPEAYEFFHRHGNFASVVNNVATVARANNALPPDRRRGLAMYGPILRSTLREQPHRAWIAWRLGMNSIGSTSFLLRVDDLIPTDPRWANETCDDRPAAWNYYRAAAMGMAAALQIDAGFHRPFPGVVPSPDLDTPEDALMFPRILDAVEREPDMAKTLNESKIAAGALRILDGIRAATPHDQTTPEERQHAIGMAATLGDALARHEREIDTLLSDDQTTVRICWRHDMSTNVLPGEEWRPCCVYPSREKISASAKLREVYGGEYMRGFAAALRSGEMPSGCQGCRDMSTVLVRDLLLAALVPGRVGDQMGLYNRGGMKSDMMEEV